MKPLVRCAYLLAGVIMFSCNDTVSPIGSSFFEDNSLSLVTVDTLTVRTSTVTFDSLSTNDATRLLVGHHIDPDLGEITSAAYFQIAMDVAFSLDKLTTTYSRTELRLIHDGYSFYDTTSELSFEVHQLKQELAVRNDGYIYNASTFRYDPTPMGTISYPAKPHLRRDTVVVPLSDAFGRNIVTLAQEDALQVSSTFSFLDYFYGLAIIPTSANGPIVGYSTIAEARVYYIDKTTTPSTERYLIIGLEENLKYNRITCDRSATTLDGLKSVSNYGSDKTNRKGYMQSGAGLGLRIEIPYLRNMLIQHSGLTVMSATLEISPSRDNKDVNTPLPFLLSMSSVNYKNQLLGNYNQQAVLNEDYYLERDTHYEVDITAFVNQEISIEELNKNALLFTTVDSTYRSTVTRLYVGDQKSDRPMKVSISCLVY